MKVKVCPKCGAHNDEGAWTCQKQSCGEILPMATLKEVGEGGGPSRSPSAEPMMSEQPIASTSIVGAAFDRPIPPLYDASSRPKVSGAGGAVLFVLSVAAGLWGVLSLAYGVSGGDGNGVIQLAPIYSGLGLIMLAVLLAILGVAVQIENCWKGWQRTAGNR